MKRDAATAELSRAQLEAEVAQLRSENAALRTVEPAPQSAAQPAVLGAAWGDPAGDPPAPPPSGQPAVLGAAWGGPAFDPLAPPPAPDVLGAAWGGGPVAPPAVLGAAWGGGVAPVPLPARPAPAAPAPAPAPARTHDFRPADRVECGKTGEQGIVDRVWPRGEGPPGAEDDGPFIDVAFGNGEVGTFKARYFRRPTAPPRIPRGEPPAALLYAEKVSEPQIARDSDSEYSSEGFQDGSSSRSSSEEKPAIDTDSDDALIWVPKVKHAYQDVKRAPGEALVCPACEASYLSGRFCPKCERKLVPALPK